MPDDIVRVPRPRPAKAADAEAASLPEMELSGPQRVRRVVRSGALPRRLLHNRNNLRFVAVRIRGSIGAGSRP